MKFFERQRIDEIGYVSVRLQKILLFLILVHMIGFFTTDIVNWLGTLLEIFLLLLAFFGALNRKEGALRAYFGINIALLILAILAIPFLAVAGSSNADDQAQTQASLKSFNHTTTVTTVTSMPIEEKAEVHINIFGVFLFALGLVAFILKISTIIIAFRLARMIREQQARNLAHPAKRTETHAVAPQQASYMPVHIQYVQPDQDGHTIVYPHQFAQYPQQFFQPIVYPFPANFQQTPSKV